MFSSRITRDVLFKYTLITMFKFALPFQKETESAAAPAPTPKVSPLGAISGISLPLTMNSTSLPPRRCFTAQLNNAGRESLNALHEVVAEIPQQAFVSFRRDGPN